MIDTLTISRELIQGRTPARDWTARTGCAAGADKETTDTHQPQTDWWHEGLVLRALPYCMHVVDRRAEILDRRYRLIIALNLRRKPTDRRLAAIAHNGKCPQCQGWLA